MHSAIENLRLERMCRGVAANAELSRPCPTRQLVQRLHTFITCQAIIGLLGLAQALMRFAARSVFSGMLSVRAVRPLFRLSSWLGRLAFNLVRSQMRRREPL